MKGETPRDTSSLEMPRRREAPPENSGKDAEAVAAVKRALTLNHERVIDFLRKHDMDDDSTISPLELRRALAALSIPIDPRAMKLLFKTIDKDGSGGISFGELNTVLRRQVDFSTGGGEVFDAATGTYTTSATAVKSTRGKKKRRGAKGEGEGAPIRLDMTAEVLDLTPQFVNIEPPTHEQLSRARAGFAAGREQRFSDEDRQQRANRHERANAARRHDAPAAAGGARR